MGYFSKLQVIQRGRQNRQFYLICPAPLAAALELQKGEPPRGFARTALSKPGVAPKSGRRDAR